MFCPNCGKDLPEYAKFCDECGKRLANEEPQKTIIQNKNPFDESPTSSLHFEDQNGEESEKNSGIVGILWLLGGLLGFHDFYCGNLSKGLTKAIFGTAGIILSVIHPVMAIAGGVAIIIDEILVIIDAYKIGKGQYMDKNDCYVKESWVWGLQLAVLIIVPIVILLVIIIPALFK